MRALILPAACAALLGGCATGDAVRTLGYKLPARYVIHAVGPIWTGGAESEPTLLARAYESAFARARTPTLSEAACVAFELNPEAQSAGGSIVHEQWRSLAHSRRIFAPPAMRRAM